MEMLTNAQQICWTMLPLDFRALNDEKKALLNARTQFLGGR